MICILNPSADAAYNLAAEEYLFTIVEEDCFMLWQSHEAVIIGRNQNAWSQVNALYIRKKGIPILRRMSGGGTVYHDMGNVNFTYIRRLKRGFQIAYGPFLEPVQDFLVRLGVPAAREGKSDLVIDGYKISGNAQHLQKDKVLHHGTLLFDSDLSALSIALRITEGRYRDKSVDSIRKKVANIRPNLKSDMTIVEFMARFMAYIQKENSGRRVEFSPSDRRAIKEIADRRYKTWEWNIGHGPDYGFEHVSDRYAIRFEVRSGIMENVRISGNGMPAQDLKNLETILTGRNHRIKDIAVAMSGIASISKGELMEAMF